MSKTTRELPKGYYETVYGNTAEYHGGKYAQDVDAAERIPVELLGKFIRPFDRYDWGSAQYE